MIAAKLSLLLVSTATMGAQAAEMKGYIMDNQCISWLCYGKEKSMDTCTPDGVNSFYNPEDHSGWCLKLGLCVQRRYSLMSEFPGDDGFHTPVLNMTGDAIQAKVLDYIDTTNPHQLTAGTKSAFPLVKVTYEDRDLVTTEDSAIPMLEDGAIVDPWGADAAPYSGAATTQTICAKASDASMDNNLCFRSDIVISKPVNKKMIAIESGACPDHDNMSGGKGKIPNNNDSMPADPGMLEGPPACGVDPCGLDPCGLDPCGLDPCGLDPCGLCGAGCGTDPCAADKCGVCAADPCGVCAADPCAADPCAADPCAADPCAADPCAADPCAADPCAADPCAGNLSRKLECAADLCSACAADPCAADPCAADPCGADPCGVCGADPCGADKCGADPCGLCGSDPCGADKCGADPCGLCGVDPCGVDKCGADPCGLCGTDPCGVDPCGVCGGCGTPVCGVPTTTTLGVYEPTYQHYTMMVPETAGEPGTASPVADGVVGMMVNGVLLDDHEESWNFDMCNGHSDKKHQYHYHIPPICFLEEMGVPTPEDANWWMNDDMTEVRSYGTMHEQFPATGKSPVVGWARDGFPIYALYGPADGSPLERSQAYGGDLDECNGKMTDGSYAYYLTAEPPFTPTCLKGEIGSFAYAPTEKACPRAGISNTVGTTADTAPAPDDSSPPEDGSSGASSVSYAVMSIVVTTVVSFL